MNWKEIEKKYPKAFLKLNEWYGIGLLEFNKEEPERYGHYFTDGVHAVLMWNDFEIRDLYDFFDEQGIMCIVTLLNKRWVYSNIDNLEWEHSERSIFKTRKEAEKAAFLKAFEILEQKL